jgi:putative aldouronate transport system substrate-binding protein
MLILSKKGGYIMKGIKKVIAVVLTITMVIGLSACGSTTNTATSATSTSTDTKKTYDKIVYAYASFNNIPSTDTLAALEEAINKITRDKIGVEVELKPIGVVDYASSVSLSLQGGEQIDVFESLGDFNTSVSSGKAYDLTDIMDTCAPETKALLGDDILNACVQNGKVYGIPTYKPYALTPMIIYKQNIADELGIDMTKIKSIYDLTDVLRTVKKAYPDMTPFVPVQAGSSGLNYCIGDVDYLTDSYLNPTGILQGDNMSVISYYDTEEFSNLCNLARTWYNEGLILQDAAITTSTA